MLLHIRTVGKSFVKSFEEPDRQLFFTNLTERKIHYLSSDDPVFVIEDIPVSKVTEHVLYAQLVEYLLP